MFNYLKKMLNKMFVKNLFLEKSELYQQKITSH